jgi:hypothetical protein
MLTLHEEEEDDDVENGEEDEEVEEASVASEDTVEPSMKMPIPYPLR